METIASPSKTSPSGSDEPITPADAVQRLLELDDEPARRQWIAHCLAACDVDELLPFFKEESMRYLHIDPRLSLRLAETLVAAGSAAARRDYHALGLLAIGDAFRALGRFEESVAAIEQAGDEYLAIGDEVGWARGRITWIVSSQRLGRGEAALASVDEAREILVKHQVWLKAATLDMNAANVCHTLGRYDEALTRYNRVLATLRTLGEPAENTVAMAKSNKAVLLTRRGEFEAALRLHEEALPTFLKYGDTVIVARTEWNVAYVYAEQGHFTRALRHFDNARLTLERAGAEIDAAWITLHMVECYLSLNRDSEALALAEETVVRFERFGTPTEAARARYYCALAHARLGDIEQALSILDAVTHAFAATGLQAEYALTVLQRASLYLNDLNWPAARDEAERASGLFVASGRVVHQAQAEFLWARAALALGDTATAARLARSALTVSEQRGVRWLIHDGHHIRGKIAETHGDFAGALDAYADAIANIEQMQNSLTTELRINFLADKLLVYEDAIVTSLRLSQPERALTYLERAKSRALVDYLSRNLDIQMHGRAGVDTDLLETLARLRAEHNGLYNRLYGYDFSRRDNTGSAAESDDASLQAALREREIAISRLIDRLALQRSDGFETVMPGIIGSPIPSLDAGAVLLEYFFTEDGGTVFVVTTFGVVAVPLVARPREIRRLLHQWYLNLDAAARAITSNAAMNGLGQNARGILAALFRALIAPVADHIAGYERLIVVPYGPTHAVPFHALIDRGRYLLDMAEISVCPSSTLLQLCAARPRRAGEGGALVVAYSDGGRLPAVLDEARVVTALLPGRQYVEEAATRAALIAAAPQYPVLHLAAHGEARLDNPAFAHLKLADGQLSMVDVFNLELHGALVTLSACETGRSVVTGGDELVGLSRGFLYAGASTLVQSLWRVEDGSTARFMEHFYRAISNGRPKGAAVRDAQRALLAANDAHPYFWAPFQLIGDQGPL